MAKKKTINKVNSSFKIPESFSALSFNQKIISVVLIVLVIGIIGSLFPGQGITGGAISDTIFRSIDTTDMIIARVFPQFISAEKLFAYEKFVLFLLLFTVLSVLLKLFQIKGIQNAVIAGAISLISTWFIPTSVLAMIGLTYSSTYASFLILVPVLIVGFVIWKIPKSRGGYLAKSVISFILMVIFAATRDGIKMKYSGVANFALETNWFNTFSDGIITVLFIFGIWYLIRFLTITPEDQSRSEARAIIQKKMAESQGKVADAVATGIATILDKGTDKIVGYISSGGKKPPSRTQI